MVVADAACVVAFGAGFGFWLGAGDAGACAVSGMLEQVAATNTPVSSSVLIMILPEGSDGALTLHVMSLRTNVQRRRHRTAGGIPRIWAVRSDEPYAAQYVTGT